MKLAIANDHRGYDLKKYIIKHLKGVEIIDLGSDSKEFSDYSKYGIKLGEYVVENKCFGLAICGSGIGISIACNKVKGVRCAKVSSEEEAFLARQHNNANIIALSYKAPLDDLKIMIDKFVTTGFSNDERHIRRINKISELEK